MPIFAPHLRIICGNSSVGRAQPCQGWGREFESRFPLQEVLFEGPFLLGKVTQIEANDSVCQSHAGSFYFCAVASGGRQKHPFRVPNRDWKPKDVCPVVQTADKFIAEVEPLLSGERAI